MRKELRGRMRNRSDVQYKEGLTMSTISANVFVAKHAHQCIDCHKDIQLGEQYMRLYGFTETGDPMVTYHFHLRCLLGTRPDKKMQEAFRKKGITIELDHNGCLIRIGMLGATICHS
jgi:hypothetical protein